MTCSESVTTHTNMYDMNKHFCSSEESGGSPGGVKLNVVHQRLDKEADRRHVMSFILTLTVKYDVFLMKCVREENLKWQLWTHTITGRDSSVSETAFPFFFFAALHQQDAFTGLGLLVALLIWFNKQAASVKRDFIKKKKRKK